MAFTDKVHVNGSPGPSSTDSGYLEGTPGDDQDGPYASSDCDGRAGSWADLVVEVGGFVDVVHAEAAEARVGTHLSEKFGVKAERAEPRTAELGQRG